MSMIEKLYQYLNTRELSGISPVLKPVGTYASGGVNSDCNVCNCSTPDTNCCFDCYDPCGNHCEC